MLGSDVCRSSYVDYRWDGISIDKNNGDKKKDIWRPKMTNLFDSIQKSQFARLLQSFEPSTRAALPINALVKGVRKNTEIADQKTPER